MLKRDFDDSIEEGSVRHRFRRSRKNAECKFVKENLYCYSLSK